MLNKIKILVAIIFFNWCQTANAITIEKAYVHTEKEGADDKACQYSGQSSVAATESVLRHNRINISQRSDKDAVRVYLNTSTSNVLRGECALTVMVMFKSNTVAQFPGTNKKVPAEAVFCSREATGYLKATGLQSMVNDTYKGYVEECISEIEKLDR